MAIRNEELVLKEAHAKALRGEGAKERRKRSLFFLAPWHLCAFA
jgi:hypothetical protein